MILTLMGKTGDSIAPVALLGTHRTLPSSLAFSSGVLGTAGMPWAQTWGAAGGTEWVGSLGRQSGERCGSGG